MSSAKALPKATAKRATRISKEKMMRTLELNEIELVDGGSLAHDVGNAVGTAVAEAVNAVESAWDFLTSPPQTWAYQLAY